MMQLSESFTEKLSFICDIGELQFSNYSLDVAMSLSICFNLNRQSADITSNLVRL